jgi:hypothetical protein
LLQTKGTLGLVTTNKPSWMSEVESVKKKMEKMKIRFLMNRIEEEGGPNQCEEEEERKKGSKREKI